MSALLPAGLFCVFGVCSAVAQTSAAPSFTWDERWHHYLNRTYSWQRLGWQAIDTGMDVALYKDGCGRGPACYSDRLAGAFFRRTTRTTVELGAGWLLKEDIRRKPSGRTTFKGRLIWSLTHALLATGPDGRWRPAWSRFAGVAAGSMVSSAWHERPITTNRLLYSFSLMAQANLQDSVLTEFQDDLKRLGLRMRPVLLRFGRRR